jgi:hypothetical protein
VELLLAILALVAIAAWIRGAFSGVIWFLPSIVFPGIGVLRGLYLFITPEEK